MQQCSAVQCSKVECNKNALGAEAAVVDAGCRTRNISQHDPKGQVSRFRLWEALRIYNADNNNKVKLAAQNAMKTLSEQGVLFTFVGTLFAA